jgi:hypothetical protein
VGDVEQEGLEAPLLGYHDMVCMTKLDTRASKGPVDVGAVRHMEGGGKSHIMGGIMGRRASKFVGFNGSGRWWGNGGVTGVEEEGSGKGAKTTQMVNSKGIRAMCWAFSAEMTSLPWEEWEVRPCN